MFRDCGFLHFLGIFAYMFEIMMCLMIFMHLCSLTTIFDLNVRNDNFVAK